MAYPGGNYPGNYSNYPGGGYGQQPPGSGGYGGQPGYGAPGYGQQGGYPGAAPPGGYNQPGGYNPPGGPPANPGINPEVQKWFTMVDKDKSGKINAKELQAALINGRGEPFSDTACNLMIGMFDKDHSGTIDINEFEKLYAYINQWLNMFRSYDRDQSGHIEENELAQALSTMGFRFTPEFINFLVKKSDPKNHKEISVDQFIVLCVQIQKFTEAFRVRDSEQRGVITIGFEDFLTVAISLTS